MQLTGSRANYNSFEKAKKNVFTSDFMIRAYITSKDYFNFRIHSIKYTIKLMKSLW